MQAKTLARMWIVVVVIVVAASLAACGGGGESSAPEMALDAEALVNERCTQCHGIEKVTQAKKSQEQWQSTVTGMVAKGAKLNADEQIAVVTYLAETYAP